MTRKVIQIAISPGDADSNDILYVLFDDGEVRKVWEDEDEGQWVWSTVNLHGSQM
jgi:hypothetical protein